MKRDYEAESIKASQYGEKNSTLNSEFSKIKMKLQYAEDQVEKAAGIHKEKI